jgi:cbb3-type cytochrome oxidase cytochrome c subunit
MNAQPCRQLLKGALLLGVLLLLAGCVSAGRGKQIYGREKCGNCHRFRGEGHSLAPDLTAVTGSRSDDWIRRQIVAPRENDPRSRMPGFGHLSGSEVRSLLAYLKS